MPCDIERSHGIEPRLAVWRTAVLAVTLTPLVAGHYRPAINYLPALLESVTTAFVESV
jgi:hypothetical protein